jgi:hypothetical protein
MLYVWGQAPLVLFWGLVVLVNVLVLPGGWPPL